MPLSRLSNRSSRKGLSRGRGANRKSSDSVNASSSRHLRLWEAIRITREELESRIRQSEQIEELFREWIIPRETRLTQAVGNLTNTLISKLQNANDGNDAVRSLLGLWVLQNISDLHEHPFASEEQWQLLNAQFSDVLDPTSPIDTQLIKLSRVRSQNRHDNNSAENSTDEQSDKGESSVHEPDDDDIVFDFGWHKSSTGHQTDESNNGDNTSASTQNYEQENIQSTNEDDDSEDTVFDPGIDEKVNSLQKNLSVDRLFRQLAKVLHPDREQDEAKKAEKHLLMSECLAARHRKDIDTLLELYCEHVGELPEGLNDQSHEELISALELQLKQLQRKLRLERFGDSMRSQIVERYADVSSEQTQNRISRHARDLDRQIQKIDKDDKRLKTDAGFQKVLSERRGIEQDRMSINELTGGA